MASANVAREFHTQQLHYLRKTITFADNGSTVDVGVLPAGSLVLQDLSGVVVTTAFDGDTTNTVDIGYSTDSGTNNLATALALGSVDTVALDETGAVLLTANTIIQAAVVSTASAAAGSAEIVIFYVPDNDG